MFLRVLMWVVLIAAVWWFVKPRPKVGPRMPAGGPPAAPPPAAAGRRAIANAEPMVDCARCGLHFPASEAVRDGGGRAFCCAEHRAAGPRVQA